LFPALVLSLAFKAFPVKHSTENIAEKIRMIVRLAAIAAVVRAALAAVFPFLRQSPPFLRRSSNIYLSLPVDSPPCFALRSP
jgi:hypothetical protein